jgi:hypothetical protein
VRNPKQRYEFYPNNYHLRQQTLFRKSKQHISPANEEIKNLQKRSEITTFVPIRALRGAQYSQLVRK